MINCYKYYYFSIKILKLKTLKVFTTDITIEILFLDFKNLNFIIHLNFNYYY